MSMRLNLDKEFRLVPYGIFDGAMNMALDEAILEEAKNKDIEHSATLRFYGWKPPAVTIGYGQNLPTSRIAAIGEAGFDLVRRPTGGRAVLHMNELTYSFVAHEAQLGKSISEAYRKICQALILGFSKLGLSVCLGESKGELDSSYRDKTDCFLATTTADLTVNDKKLVGSAQLRRGKWVLQHGSILLEQPQDMMPLLLGQKVARGNDLVRHANLFEELHEDIDLTQLCQILKQGFESGFGAHFVDKPFNQAEMDTANRIRENFVLKDS